MKIHSSSLSLPPVNSNPKIGRNINEQNKDNNELLTAKKQEPPKKVTAPDAIKKTLATVKPDINNQDNINKPTNAHAIKALSTYNQTFNAPLHDQRAQLISGIDTYA